MRLPARPGYGLFQLLVVLAVLALLVGMLLPAVQQVRFAASRTHSMNNLKQIALAMHNFEGVNGKLPPGVDDKNFSTLFQLLPYIEQDNLYKVADRTKECDHRDNAKVRTTRVKIFDSPLDPVVETAPPGGTSYFAMAGTKMPLKENDGVFFRDSALTLAGIPDGTSNTIAFVEMLRGDGGKKAVSVERQHVRLAKGELKNLKEDSGVKDFKAGKNIAADRGSAWIDGRFLKATTNATRGLSDPKPDVDCGGEGGLAAVRMHPTGTNVALCDGSVRWITPKLTLATWQAATTAAGGEVLGPDW